MTPISADMHFRIASLTKTFVATVVLQLVDEGEISLDDTIASVLPDLTVVNADVVTIRHLLSMRSGLPQLADSPEFERISTYDPTQRMEFADFATFMADLPARNEPDTTWEYNNFNFNILGEMIEVITGESWDANVQQRISDPLGLRNTIMKDTPEMPEPFANGYGYLEQMVTEEQTEASPALDMQPV